jgi:alanyl-tRNA synthetase
MISQDIRRLFLKYFKEKGHALLPSSPVVPHEDPTLLFTNAGMNQFKEIFLGKEQRDYKRATTAQKCIRAGGKHNDLDNVGHTSRHLTFFEMLGNFSFGDYFKKEAISYAWEVSTQIFAFTPERIWITVFRDDDEAFELWKAFVPEKRIVRMDEKDNFWAMGDTGPCGPCSELYFDRGPKYGTASSILEDTQGERYLEFWNLVFMQFNRDQNRELAPLPKQSIDTGAGLERVVSLKMDVDSLFATDLLRSLIAQVEEVSGKTYGGEPAFHVIADHIRSLSFAIADGAQPSNSERGYVLRKILRRAVRYGKALDFQEPFLAKILPRLIALMGDDYPELIASQNRIAEILTVEEESFLRTLKRGGNILSSVIEDAQKSPLKEIRGDEAFKLKDTYGFPLEEILLIAKDAGLAVNLESYQILEEMAKEKSRGSRAIHTQEAEENLFREFVQKEGLSEFVGYAQLRSEGRVKAVIVDDHFVEALQEGEEGLIILDQTPFYAEKGGQVGDTGSLTHSKMTFSVSNCRTPYTGVIAHEGKVVKGTLRVGEQVTAEVDAQRRQSIANHHTATHLLHWALQKVLGPHIRQAGSLVEPHRLRFDFNHHKAVTAEEVRSIEERVNEKIRENRHVDVYELSYEEAQQRGDVKKFFDDKYGSKVQVIDIDYSKELCGGTHVSRVGNIGLFRILKESSIAAGVRRIEAVTGREAEAFMYQNEENGCTAAAIAKCSLPKLPDKVTSLIAENRDLTLQIKGLKREALKERAQELIQQALSVGSTLLLTHDVDLDPEELSLLAEDLMSQRESLIVLLAVKREGRCQLLLRVSRDLIDKGIRADHLIKEISPCIEGSGGGKAESAQAGGKNPKGIDEAFKKIRRLLEETLAQ